MYFVNIWNPWADLKLMNEVHTPNYNTVFKFTTKCFNEYQKPLYNIIHIAELAKGHARTNERLENLMKRHILPEQCQYLDIAGITIEKIQNCSLHVYKLIHWTIWENQQIKFGPFHFHEILVYSYILWLLFLLYSKNLRNIFPQWRAVGTSELDQFNPQINFWFQFLPTPLVSFIWPWISHLKDKLGRIGIVTPRKIWDELEMSHKVSIMQSKNKNRDGKYIMRGPKCLTWETLFNIQQKLCFSQNCARAGLLPVLVSEVTVILLVNS